MTSLMRRKTPVMIAIGGMSGSGKTTLADELGK
ncbi:MAG TPA: zeta toxin family protein [Patescibacteria group bacterium]|nr:zeta toxin family protein [Patescibacteria group bacterium]